MTSPAGASGHYAPSGFGGNPVPHNLSTLAEPQPEVEWPSGNGVSDLPEDGRNGHPVAAPEWAQIAPGSSPDKRQKKGRRLIHAGTRRPPSEEQLIREQKSRENLDRQARMLTSGTSASQRKEVISRPPEVAGQEREITAGEALKALGLSRRNLRMRPVVSGLKPHRTPRPQVFPYDPRQALTRLSRKVSREWVAVLTGVSTASLAGGKLNGSQGRNLIRIVEELRQHCYLRVDGSGRPLEVREQVVQVVGGEQFCFARQCGMSEATFYRALAHPLAHVFLRTQKVQRVDGETQARRNVATLFSVTLYEPEMPEQLEEAFWAESITIPQEIVVSDFSSQGESTKGRLQNTQEHRGACGKVTSHLEGARLEGSSDEARDRFLAIIDGAALGSLKAQRQEARVDLADLGLKGCIDRLRNQNPGLWEFAAHIAIHHDEPAAHAMAAVGYYKALIHLGPQRVTYWVQRVERQRLQGRRIDTPGRLLTCMLNKETRAATGFNIRDLGTESWQYMS